jgi:hypothetical protein
MRPETLMNHVRGLPGQPFRIVLNSGRSYDILHREIITVGRDVFLYFYCTAGAEYFDRWDTVSLLLIERIEQIDKPQRQAQPAG